LAEFWAEWGLLAYVAAAAWAFFEGETFVLLAAAAGRATGLINPWILTGCVWIGSFAGDQCWFLLGRRYGARAVRRIPGAERRLVQAMAFLDKYGAIFVLTFRFAYGIRNVASAACGMAGMNMARFAFLNFIAAGIWASTFVSGGWFLAIWLGPQGVGWLLGGIGLTVIAWLLYKAWRGSRKTAAAARPAE
jgi:membrane protein DedA with SNARE-associated domain